MTIDIDLQEVGQPTAHELRFAQEFLDAARDDVDENQLNAWDQFAHAILAANEFSWID